MLWFSLLCDLCDPLDSVANHLGLSGFLAFEQKVLFFSSQVETQCPFKKIGEHLLPFLVCLSSNFTPSGNALMRRSLLLATLPFILAADWSGWARSQWQRHRVRQEPADEMEPRPENIKWKTPLPGVGVGTPVVIGEPRLRHRLRRSAERIDCKSFASMRRLESNSGRRSSSARPFPKANIPSAAWWHRRRRATASASSPCSAPATWFASISTAVRFGSACSATSTGAFATAGV